MMGGDMARTWEQPPSGRFRIAATTIAVVAVVVQYYASALHGAVASLVVDHFHMSLRYYALIAILGNLGGAAVAVIGSLADRYGRIPLMVAGQVGTGLVLTLAVPAAGDKPTFLAFSVMANALEGMVVVATAAYVRDLSPLGSRGTAMGWWAMGPVLGGVIVSVVAALTLHAGAGWQTEYRVCGVASLLAAVVVAVFLCDVAPEARNRASVEVAVANAWRPPRGSVLITSLGFGVMEIFYFTLISYFVLYATRGLGLSSSRANALALFFYAGTALGFVIFGWLGDRYLLRRQIVLVGSALSSTALIWWVLRSPDSTVTPQGFLLLAVGFFGAGSVANWLASFSELLDRTNPAGVAKGFAVWGAAVRVAIVFTLVAVALLVPDLAKKNLDPARHAALLDHWRIWWWVCVGGRLVFLPTIALLPRQESTKDGVSRSASADATTC